MLARLLLICVVACISLLGFATAAHAESHPAHDGPLRSETYKLKLPSGRTVTSRTVTPPVAAFTSPFVHSGRRWPGRTIRYWDTTPRGAYRIGVAKAIAEWNSRGLPVRFVRASSKRSAQFVIMVDRRISPGGLATVGYWGGGQSYWVKLNMQGYGFGDVAWVASHELGHILGLGHSRACAVMSYSAYDVCKWPDRTQQWRCRLQERDDLMGVKRLYGGRFRLRPQPFCLLSPASGNVTGLTAVGNPLDGTPQLTWAAAARATGVRGGYHVLRSAAGGACPTAAAAVTAQSLGTTKLLTYTDTSYTFGYQPLPEGVYCYSVFSLNRDGYLNPASRATVSFTYAIPPIPVPVMPTVVVTRDDSWGEVSWSMAISAGVPEGAEHVTVGRGCPATPDEASLSLYGGTGSDYLRAYDGFTAGAQVCYRFWASKWVNGQTRYSAPVDVVATLT